MNEVNAGDIRQLQSQLGSLQAQLAGLMNQPSLPDHKHTGFDASRILWSDLAGRTINIHHTILGADAATATYYSVFYIVPVSCYLSKFQEVHTTAGTAGGSVTLNLEKLTSGQAPDSGVVMLDTAIDLKSTANVVNTSSYITATAANRNLSPGDRLCLKDSGTLTSVANVTVFVELTIS